MTKGDEIAVLFGDFYNELKIMNIRREAIRDKLRIEAELNL